MPHPLRAAPSPFRAATAREPMSGGGEAASSASASAYGAPSQAVSGCTSAPGEEAGGPTAVLTRLHILPFIETDRTLGSKSRIDFLAPELRRRRNVKELIRTGDLIRHDGLDFAVIKCEPPEGLLGPDTDFFVDGSPITPFEKIQFSAWGPSELSNEALFKECVIPYFKGEWSPYGSSKAKRLRLFYCNQIFQIGEIFFSGRGYGARRLGRSDGEF